MALRLALFTLSAFASLVLVSADSLSLKVTGPAQVDDISGLRIKATLKNTGASALTLVNDPWSVLSTTPTDTFSISRESGGNPAFTGMRVRYSFELAVKQGAVTTLNPGQSIDVTHSLADAYNFTNSGPGTYDISPSKLLHTLSEAGNPQRIYANLEMSHTVTISGSGRLAAPRREAGDQKLDKILMKRATSRYCTAVQQNQIGAAIPGAISYINDAISYLSSHTTASQRFTTWFGRFTSDNRGRILRNFNSLGTRDSFTSWLYDCGCKDGGENLYAYVFPDQYGVVYLCRAFWGIPQERVNTLVHEGSHFFATASTEDYAYGEDNCMRLAQSDPNRAIRNADSLTYFAQNSPPLP